MMEKANNRFFKIVHTISRKKVNTILLLIVILLFPIKASAQWGFDVPVVEAYINDHKQQRSLLLARSTLELSNQLLHGYSSEATVDYKNLNVVLDKYTRAFDVIDVLYQSLRTSLNVYSTYQSVSERVQDYKHLLEDYNDKVLKRNKLSLGDTLLIGISLHCIQKISDEGNKLYRSLGDLVLYATGAAACSTSDLLLVLESINTGLDNIEKHLNNSYFETWRYIQLRMGYWKESVYRTKSKSEIIEGAFGRWKESGLNPYKNKLMMKRILFLSAAVMGICPLVMAQSVTYNHDDAKMNQITVMEIGSGGLTPSLYYNLLHKSYQKSASSKNKLAFRTTAGLNLYAQVDDAEALDSALNKRAKIEALNVADRSGGALDLAWVAESGKLNSKMADFERNIRRVLEVGGTGNEQTHWKEYYNVYQSAIKAAQNAYMPNAQRKKEYLRIYADVARKNETLILYIVRLSNARKTSELLAATGNIENHKAQIVRNALSRWRDAGWSTSKHGLEE